MRQKVSELFYVEQVYFVAGSTVSTCTELWICTFKAFHLYSSLPASNLEWMLAPSVCVYSSIDTTSFLQDLGFSLLICDPADQAM